MKNDGTVWAWGYNGEGQLGIGTTTALDISVQVPGIAGVIRIAAAENTVALKSDGTVWVWGPNASGQLGNGTYISSLTPIQVAGLDGVVAIAAGGRNAALKSDGSVWEWGDNSSGQNGNGTYKNSAIPVQSLINLGIANNPYNGLWWNPDESGWGMSITQHNAMIFAALYTYDQAGQPTWYVMSSCPIVAVNSCTGEIYKVTDGTQPVVPWKGSGKVVSSVGSGTLTFADANNATFNYTLEGVAGTKSITRQIFAMDNIPPAVDYSDLWWNPNESGWGVAITQEYGMIFAAWYTYDASGKAIWYVASRCPIIGNGCTGDMY